MSPTTATSSPRDDHVDADQDLARKKQRLSEDKDDSNTDNILLVEAFEPENIGTTFGNAIEIEDDEDMMPLYSADFDVRKALEPLPQVEALLQEVGAGKYYLQVEEFQNLAGWIRRHCNGTDNDGFDVWKQQYSDFDREFFSKLGSLLVSILTTPDLFEPGDVHKAGMRNAVEDFLVSTSELSSRIIPLLPDIINTTLSRRDSALQGSTISHPVELFQFLAIAVRSFPAQSAMARDFHEHAHFAHERVTKFNTASQSAPEVVAALGTIVKMLGGAMRQIKESWTMLDDILTLFNLIIANPEITEFPHAVFEEIMEVFKACILPAICAKHPGALPDNFHNHVIQVCSEALFCASTDRTHEDACQIYLKYVKSDEDAILHEELDQKVVFDVLADVSEGDVRSLSQLLISSWSMQAALSYIRSDIMNVRSLGLSALSQQLKEVYEQVCKAQDWEHFQVRHAVRFLRKNEVTKYIFSSDSHASLVSESSTVITFLSATKAWTNQETDVIWRACSTSVEADFVKASFNVLENQLCHLDFWHVLHVLEKYGNTPIDGLGAAAVDFLPCVLRKLSGFGGSLSNSRNRLDLAISTVEVLKHVDTSKTSVFSNKLRSALHVQIAGFGTGPFTTSDRRGIYAHCLPDIGRHASGSTTAAEVLTILLSCQLPIEDSQTILSMLPVSTAVDDLQHFVSKNQGQEGHSFAINSITLRLSCILRLMSLHQGSPDNESLDTIFNCVFGKDALGEYARGAAWDKLHALTVGKNSPPAAISLWKIYMQRYVPSMSPKLASSRLVQLIVTYLAEECRESGLADDQFLLLKHPLWETLIRFATTSTDRSVIDAATGAIAQFLFAYAAHPERRTLRDSAAKCQQETVRLLIQTIQSKLAQSDQNAALEQERDAHQAINLLHTLLLRSREFAAFYAPASEDDVVALDTSVDETDSLSFTLQVYSPEPQPQVMFVQASKTTTVSQLLESLPSKTGAKANRVIAGGKEITGMNGKSLSEAGVHNTGVIQIRPRYKQDFDFDHLLMSAGPVEKEIVAHFDALETLLDAPGQVAERTSNFLRVIPPPSKARYKVAQSAEATADEIFPNDKPARAQFSIHILDWHLRDCARIGIADAGFLKRGVRLLTSALLDQSRGLVDTVTPQLLNCLHAFLQERTSDNDKDRYFEDGSAFATGMIDRLIEIERSAEMNRSLKIRIATDAYSALLLASRVDDSVWGSFSTDHRAATLHANLLMHNAPRLSEGIARVIRGVCQDDETQGNVPNFFWETLITALPQALHSPAKSFQFFMLASDVLHCANKIQEDETNTRDLIQQLSTALWSYEHTETANDPARDNAMAGLLKLLTDAVTILKSFKKPLQLDRLSSRIVGQLLFPDENDQTNRPIINEETRVFAYDLARLTLESAADFEQSVEILGKMAQKSVRLVGAKYPGYSDWIRLSSNCAGLTNLGMTCYMNSMLQQLFGNVQFRKFILKVPLDHPEKQRLLLEVQNLFGKMQSSVDPTQDTMPLAQALGIQIGNQEDVHDFYASLMSKLEDEMPDTDSKMALSRFFTGQSITQIRGECGHVSSQKEAFGDLSVTVKNKANLHDSLAEFVQGEPMEGANKYKCMSCDPENGRLVDAMRRTCLEEVPDCLTVCLKRFTFGSKFLGEGKVNDRFDFPEVIDMSAYKRTHLEAPEQPHDQDLFELTGVIVHQGSLDLGHYWSYVRFPSLAKPGAGDWYCLEDTKTNLQPTGFDVVQQQCFGGCYDNGKERPDNAYVLFYQRKGYVAGASTSCKVDTSSCARIGLPRVHLGESLAAQIDKDNSWKHRISALFDPRFANHVCWLFNQYPHFREMKAIVANPELDLETTGEQPRNPESSALEDNMGTLITNFVLRILLPDPARENKLSQTTSAIGAALDTSPKLPQTILRVFAEDAFGFETALENSHARSRAAVFELLKACINRMREQDRSTYIDAIRKLLYAHSKLLHTRYADKHPHDWAEYFIFPIWVAGLGFEETGMVLDSGYLQWIVEIIWMSTEPDWKQKHLSLFYLLQRDSTVDFDPLLNFIYEVLKEHVDLSDLTQNPEHDEGPRMETGQGWILRTLERDALMHSTDTLDYLWTIYLRTFARCRTARKGWRDYGLGKLVGLLSSDKPDDQLKMFVMDTLVYQYDKEQEHLSPMMFATLHMCANNEDEHCKQMLLLFAKSLLEWNQDRKTIWFFTEAFSLAPHSVIESTQIWVFEILCAKGSGPRQMAADWLLKHVFVDRPLSNDHGLDAGRVRVARSLGKDLSDKVKTAYYEERPRTSCEEAMNVLQAIATYLSKLQEAVMLAQADNKKLPNDIVVENDEARSLLPSIGEVLTELEDWESDIALPTRNMHMKHPVEIDETDEMVSDEDEELDDYDEYSQSV